MAAKDKFKLFSTSICIEWRPLCFAVRSDFLPAGDFSNQVISLSIFLRRYRLISSLCLFSFLFL